MASKGYLAVIGIGLLFILFLSLIVLGAPVGPNTITYLGNRTRGLNSPVSRSQDERGHIITVRMNVTQQSLYWKAYVGNVTGKITLDDDLNFTIYDWAMGKTSGEVYATRKSTAVTWTNVFCANNSVVEREGNLLNHTILKSDCLNKTFINNNHAAFWVGSLSFSANQCKHTVHTYVSDHPQVSSFSELLLYDPSGYLVYASIINNSAKGYDNGYYDFQMLVAEKGQDGIVTPLTYYFYVELT